MAGSGPAGAGGRLAGRDRRERGGAWRERGGAWRERDRRERGGGIGGEKELKGCECEWSCGPVVWCDVRVVLVV